ncbi:MAG: XRE family transcriptional regulator [Comamonadaceae bacterium]|nr:MAG: XRE family transcriptional regulator [Comamonadaceae bacterium]
MVKTTEIILFLRQQGLSQTEIAKRSGVPQCRISRWERGDVARAADDALKLAELARGMGAPSSLPSSRAVAHG